MYHTPAHERSVPFFNQIYNSYQLKYQKYNRLLLSISNNYNIVMTYGYNIPIIFHNILITVRVLVEKWY